MTPSQTKDLPPVPPEAPADEECCRSGCDPCIFDLHAQEMERYRQELRAWEERQKEKGLGAGAGSAGTEVQ